MGADIQSEGRFAAIHGVSKLTGCKVTALDLRAGAALVTAALGAYGETSISHIDHLERGMNEWMKRFAALVPISYGGSISRGAPGADDVTYWRSVWQNRRKKENTGAGLVQNRRGLIAIMNVHRIR